jgi:hypothetical protein
MLYFDLDIRKTCSYISFYRIFDNISFYRVYILFLKSKCRYGNFYKYYIKKCKKNYCNSKITHVLTPKENIIEQQEANKSLVTKELN